MTSVHNSLPCKNTTIRSTPLTAKSTCRSTNCWLNSTSSRIIKTWWIWHYPHNPNKHFNPFSLSNNRNSHMRNYYNRTNMPTKNRPKSPHCLLLSGPHRTSNLCHAYSNSMKYLRCNYPNSCPRPDLLNTILFGQHTIRTNKYPNINCHTRNTKSHAPNNLILINCKPDKPSPTPNN